MPDLTLAPGDTAPPLMVTLYDRNVFPPCPVDLTDATSVEIIWRATDSTVDVRRPARIVAPRLDGVVAYDWQAGDTATPSRRWVAFAVTSPAGVATYSGYEVLVAARLPEATAADIAAVRRYVGNAAPPTDADIARALAELGSPSGAARALLVERRASLLAGPLKRTDPDGIDYDYTANLKHLDALIAELADVDADGDGEPDGGARRLRAYSLTRADGYR